MIDDVLEKIKQYSFKLLSIRPRSIYELNNKLNLYCSKHDYNLKIVIKVIKILENLDLLNDEKFATWWIEQRDYFKPKGKFGLIYELKKKGISDDIIKKVLSLANQVNDHQFNLALKVIQKKSRFLDNISLMNKKNKIREYLYQRGFDMEIISKVIDYYTKKE